jgi:cell wall-associated NlpC family hydrolase
VSGRAAIAVATAAAQVGKPYQWGAAGPDSFDCSGLTMFAWAAAGVGLPHNAGAQYAVTAHIPLSALQPGDLVFFFGDLSHVGIYVGGGTMIHAPHAGASVEYASIDAMGTTVILAGRVG